ncbi:7377_t:CDS:10 [Ambispora leptoticha]|uniref:7377_t:CDS:1 n=1 Tax=Ambispora leptoticha TaxID=144679 RepID=A0A9N8VV89_9GLOM|nr:7377_t:CDS:10 [Ambispora leptoticha]
MACDLSDPSIMRAYEEIISMQDTTNWLILGYHGTRNKISLYSKGSGGLDEFGQNLREEILYAFLRIDDKFVFLTDVQRARGLVHGRVVAALFKMHQMQIRASTREEVSEVKMRLKLLDELPNVSSSFERDQNHENPQIILPPDNNESEQQIKDNYNGTSGLDELRQNLKEEVLYGFLRIENRFVLITYVSEQVSGVRRARALVHGRAVGALFKQAHQIQINASNASDLAEDKVRSKLKLSSSDDRPSSPSPQRQQTLRQNTLPSSPKSPNASESDASDLTPYNINGSENARREAEKAAREDAEREKLEREAQRRDAEKIAQELEKRRAFEETERKKQEALENQKKEKALAEAKAKSEAEKKVREEAEKKRNEELRSKFAELEKSGKVLLDGYITVQGGGVYFWKRRYFELRGQTLYLFRDSTDKLPISKLELDSDVSGVSDAQSEVLILNSFKVDFRSTEPYYFFSDDRKTKESFVQAIARYVK